jgi:sarcosine oxidase
MYTVTPDQHFVVACHPVHPQVVIGAGFSGHGYKFAPVVGEVLGDLAVKGATVWPVEFLGIHRFDNRHV